MFFVCGYLFCNLFTQYFGCSPVSKFWTHDTPGHCINIIKADLAYGSMNVISDFFIFVLPLPMVWRLNLTRKEKIGVYLVFMSGAIAFTVAIVRFGRGFKSFHPTSQAQLAAEISNRSLLEINTILEINTGLICGCTPALKHLFKHFSPPKRVTEQLQHIGDDFGPIIHFKRPSIFHIGFSLASSLESGTYRSDSTTHDLNVNSSLDESETTLDSCTSQKSSEITIAGSIDPNELSSPVAHDQGGRKSE
ncbi:hypothetical protein MMC14_002201 [Varicellaria rhodocarpa]|nr:hypothetical protein [Varicellaria rhodocarpa]